MNFLPVVTIAFLTTAPLAVSQLTEKTTVPLGAVFGILASAVAVFSFTGGLVWWLGRKLQNLEDRLESVEKELKSRPCQISSNCPVQE